MAMFSASEINNPTDTHAAYPLGLTAEIGEDKVGGFKVNLTSGKFTLKVNHSDMI